MQGITFRTSPMVVIVTAVGFALGLALSAFPVEFRDPVYEPLRSIGAFSVAALYAGGAVLLERGRYRTGSWARVVLLVAPTLPLLLLGILLARGGAHLDAVLCGVLAMGLLVESWLPPFRLRWSGESEADFPSLLLAVALLTGAPLLPRLSPLAVPAALISCLALAPAAVGHSWSERYRWPLRLLGAAAPALLTASSLRSGLWVGSIGWGIWSLAILSGWRPRLSPGPILPPMATPSELDGVLPESLARLEARAPLISLLICVVGSLGFGAVGVPRSVNVGVALILAYCVAVRWVIPGGSPARRAFWHVTVLTLAGGVLSASLVSLGHSLMVLLVIGPIVAVRVLPPKHARHLMALLIAVVIVSGAVHVLLGEGMGASLSQTAVEIMAVIAVASMGTSIASEQRTLLRQISEAHDNLQAQHAELQEAHTDLQAQEAELAAQQEELLAMNQELVAQQEELVAQNEELAAQGEVLQFQQVQLQEQRDRLEEALASVQAAKDALEASEARFSGLLGLAGDAIIAVDRRFNVALFNRSAERIFGYRASDVIGQPLQQFIPAECLERLELDALAGTDHPSQPATGTEISCARRDGSPFPAEVSVARLLIEHETLYTIILRDVTERKQAQAEMDQLRRSMELILNAAGDGIYGTNPDGRVTFVNPAAASLLGYTVSDLLGKPIHAIIHRPGVAQGKDVPEECPVCWVGKDGLPRQGDDVFFWRRDRSSFPAEYVSTPIREGGRLVGTVVTFRDITDRRAVEQMKNEFISVVSHELRTPLTSIRGSLGLLASGVLGSLEPKARRMVDIAAQNSDRLVRLINDILDIERMESGKVTMELQECDAASLMTQAAEVMQTAADKAGVILKVEPLKAPLLVDADRILQTLTNLLSNAIKFSGDGTTIRVKARRDGAMYLFQVIDQGRGIPADRLETIFERFRQVDASDARQKGGTGLGLAICRSIVQQHGGRIWAESVLGQGSTISFTLPAPASAEPIPETAPAMAGGPTASPTVLLCHFAPERLEALGRRLEQQGYGVLVAATSQEAVGVVRERRPSAVVVDLGGPPKLGIETIAAVKADPVGQALPLIIQSAWSLEPGEPGVHGVDWVADLQDETALPQALERVMNRKHRDAQVLVVEDDPDLTAVLLAMFNRHGIHTRHARTGQEAINLIEQSVPDLLVLDLYLPEVDGFTVVDWLRRHDRLQHVPLVVYTARDLGERDRQRLQTGRTVFLTKGRISHAELEERVVTLLHQLTQPKGDDTGGGSLSHLGHR